MIPFLALVRKDLKLFFNDRKAVVVGLLVPIVLASFFGYMFGGQSGNTETSKVPVLVIDQDGSEVSQGLIAQLGSDKNLDVKPSTLDAAREADRKALRDLLGGVNELNLQRDREGASGRGELSGGLTMPYETREQAITSGQDVEYNGYAHAFSGMGVQFILFMGLDVGIALLMLR